MIQFHCTKCNKTLKKTAAHMICAHCNTAWEIVAGIPHFSEDEIYWGEITQDEMVYVNAQLKKNKYWKEVLKEVTEKNPRDQIPEPYSFAVDLSRANWNLLLPKNKRGSVLDIGSGMGTNAEILAQYYGDVVAVEPVIERVVFCKKRFEQEGIKNIQVIKATVFDLPFAENSFDMIVMNGVFEWVAVYRKGNPQTVQESVLKKLFKLLKPGGYLYIGIENRLYYKHLFGGCDPHNDLRFVTILPRWVANQITWLVRGKQYREYIYSNRGYRTMLTNAGFRTVDIYNVMPDYNIPSYILPLNQNNIYAYYADMFPTDSLLKKLYRFVWKCGAKTGLVKHVLPAFILLSRK